MSLSFSDFGFISTASWYYAVPGKVVQGTSLKAHCKHDL